MKKKNIICACLIMFVIVSFLCIGRGRKKIGKQYRSSQLQKTVIKDNDTERTDYIDPEGRIVTSASAGYATMIKSNTENGVLEQYYDNAGEPIKRFSQYYAVLREYDEHGNNIKITYLDLIGNPCMIKDGYSIEKREYNDKNQIIKVWFYDEAENRVCTPLYGYGMLNEYDENGNNIRSCYLNSFGNLMVTAQGYASVIRQYYPEAWPDKERIEREFYYDNQGRPVALTLGQYGIQKKFNELGQGIEIIYLNADGMPIITNKGFTKVVRTFYADNNVATEQYYDMEGNPVALSEGQFGIKNDNGQVLQLNRNGQVSFNLKNLLNYCSWLVIPIAVAVVFLTALIKKSWNAVLLILYICVIIYFTLMFRDSSGEKKVGFLWYYRRFFTNSSVRSDIIKNIWLFIPLGAILYQIYPQKNVLIIPIVMSIIIEGIQYSAGIGYCELDDIISNSIGGIVGFIASGYLKDCILSIKNKKQKKMKKVKL